MGSVLVELGDGSTREVSREVLMDLKNLAELKVGDVSEDEFGLFSRPSEGYFKINGILEAEFTSVVLDAAEHHVKGRAAGLSGEELRNWDKSFVEKQQQWPAARIWSHGNTAHVLGHTPSMDVANDLLQLPENQAQVMRSPFNVYELEFTERLLSGIQRQLDARS